MNHALILAVVLLLVIAGTASWPAWQWSQGWGYGPASGLIGILLIILVLKLVGVI